MFFFIHLLLYVKQFCFINSYQVNAVSNTNVFVLNSKLVEPLHANTTVKTLTTKAVKTLDRVEGLENFGTKLQEASNEENPSKRQKQLHVLIKELCELASIPADDVVFLSVKKRAQDDPIGIQGIFYMSVDIFFVFKLQITTSFR